MEMRVKKLSERWGQLIDKWTKLIDAPHDEDADYNKLLSDMDDAKKESMAIFRESAEVLAESLEAIARMDSKIEEIHSMLLTK